MTTSNNALPSEVRQALQRAAEWHLIAILLERPGRHSLADLEFVSCEIIDPQLRKTSDAVSRLAEETYLKLFGPGGTISPREVAYIGWQDPGKMLAQLEMLYEAFCYRPQVEDPADHMGVEAGFVSYLYIKEAYAQLALDPDALAVTTDVREKFIEEHFGPLVQGLRKKLTVEPFSSLLISIFQRLKDYSIPESPLEGNGLGLSSCEFECGSST